MGTLTARGKGKKAKVEAKGAARAARLAAKDMARGRTKRAKAEGQVAAAATKEAAKDAALALKELSTALVEQTRESEALARAQAKGSELAELAMEKIHERGLDDKATEMLERVRDADATKQTVQAARRYSDEGLGLLGAWLASGARADKLGVQPRKRRFPAWLAALVGLGVGYAAAVYTRGQQPTDATIHLPPSERPLADRIRTALGEDPRTSGLPKLNINVAEGTVFVRGPVPEGIEESTIRDVITRIPGVQDIDLQLTPA